MSDAARSQITRILLDAREMPAAERTSRLTEALYPELRRLAGNLMRRERHSHTLQPTALVSEAFLRLVDQSRLEWTDRAHFLGIAARVMRQILIDHARRHRASKRGAGIQHVTLGDDILEGDRILDVLLLNDTLDRLAVLDPRSAQVVELRVFGGLTVDETAQVLAVSKRSDVDLHARPFR